MGIKIKDLRRGDIILLNGTVGIVVCEIGWNIRSFMNNLLVCFIDENGKIKRDLWWFQYPDYEVNAIRE